MIRPAILFLTLCLTATPAAAHWDRTRWGMTPEAVKALYPSAVPGSDPAKPVLRLQEPHVFDGQSFSRARVFFRDQGKLNLVELASDRNADQVPGLLVWLERRYGKPVATEGAPTVPASDAGFYRAEYAAADGDKVALVIMLWPNGEALSVVSWSPGT